MEELDHYGNGKINYTEFLAATVDAKTFLNDAKLKSVLSMFDTDSNGKITEENMFFAFQKLGYEVPKKEIRDIIAAHDLEKNGVLSYEEFKVIFD